MAQKRRNMLAETRLLMEYLAERYAGMQWFTQFRVGSDPELVGVTYEDEAERRLARNVCRRADAAVVTPTELVIIEATMWRATEKVGRLQEYLLLAPATPELQPYLGRPLVGELVTAQHDPVAEVLCRRQGFRYVFREPAWIEDFRAMYPDRRRRAPHAGMVAALAKQTEQQP
jgi:hypothetical protein